MVTIVGGKDRDTELLLHFGGADESTAFLDSSKNRHTIVRVGDTVIDTAQSKFGGTSGRFNSNYIRTDSTIDLSGRFTLELFARRNTDSGTMAVFSTSTGLRLNFINLFGSYSLDVNLPDDDNMQYSGLSANTWYHIGIIRDGNYTMALFVDGALVAVETAVTTDFTSLLYIGSRPSGDDDYKGWMDEFRASSVHRWASSFTPPTAPYR